MDFFKYIMGSNFSQSDYKERLGKFSQEFLTLEHSADLDSFLLASDDFGNVFTTIFLEDFRSIKDAKCDNIVHIVSHVSHFFSTNGIFRIKMVVFIHISFQIFLLKRSSKFAFIIGRESDA